MKEIVNDITKTPFGEGKRMMLQKHTVDGEGSGE